MQDWPAWAAQPTVIDGLALAVLALGVVAGALRGLGPLFGVLLWMLVALWIASEIAPVVLRWLPNAADAGDREHRLLAYGLLCLAFLGLPALARLLGGAAGRKKEDPLPQYRAFGALVGGACATLLLTLALPFAARVPWVGDGVPRALAAQTALRVAEGGAWLFPPAHREALGGLVRGPDEEPVDAAASEPDPQATPR